MSATSEAEDLGVTSFEDALAELDKIVRSLESGQRKLEEAITAYERAARLKAFCEARLREAETRVQLIVDRGDGAPELAEAPLPETRG